MKEHSSATLRPTIPIPFARSGLGWGLLGVAAFSLTMPLTRLAVAAGRLSPLLVGSGRAVIAAALAGLALAATRQPLPRGRQWVSVTVVAAGAVAGFPLLTSFALDRTPASHGAVVVALLPAATAGVAVLRTRERPGRRFWVAVGAGAVAAVAFALLQARGLGRPQVSDALLFAAVAVCAVAYAEGGVLSRELGSWQTISWALVAASPVMVALTIAAAVERPPATATATEWAAVAYLGVGSMFLGFVAWYRGLAIGPIARVSQVQLAQPVLSLCWAALILHESITGTTLLGGLAVVACALIAVRSRARPVAPSAPSRERALTR